MLFRSAEGLSDVLSAPMVIKDGVSVWAQYTVQTADRDGLAAHLRGQEIPTAVYYPLPLHRQAPYAHYPQPGGLPVTEAAADRVISLPMHAYLAPDVQDRIILAIRNFVKRNG